MLRGVKEKCCSQAKKTVKLRSKTMQVCRTLRILPSCFFGTQNSVSKLDQCNICLPNTCRSVRCMYPCLHVWLDPTEDSHGERKCKNPTSQQPVRVPFSWEPSCTEMEISRRPSKLRVCLPSQSERKIPVVETSSSGIQIHLHLCVCFT